MDDRNGKSKHSLTKFRVLDYEYICDRIAKFHKNILLLHKLLIFKYWRQNISVSNIALHAAIRHSGMDNAPVHRARETEPLLTHETPDVITPALWPANSPDLNPVECRLRDLEKAAGARVPQPDSWRRPAEVAPDRRVGTFPPGGHRWSGHAVASTSSRLRLSTRWTFWTQTLGVLTSCHSHGRTLDSESRLCLSDTYAFEWPY